jgi:hypothetical protein
MGGIVFIRSAESINRTMIADTLHILAPAPTKRQSTHEIHQFHPLSLPIV